MISVNKPDQSMYLKNDKNSKKVPLYLQILLDKNTLAEDFPRFVQSYQNPIGIIRHLGRNYDKVDFETREIDIGSPWILEHKYSWANQ